MTCVNKQMSYDKYVAIFNKLPDLINDIPMVLNYNSVYRNF